MNHRIRIKGRAALAAGIGATTLGGGALLTATLLSGGCGGAGSCTGVDVPSVEATVVCSDEARDAVADHDDETPLIIEMRLDAADPWAEARCDLLSASATANACAAGAEPVVARCRDPWNRYNEGGRFHVRARQGELVSEETTIRVTGDRCHPITVDIDLMLHLAEDRVAVDGASGAGSHAAP